MMREEQFSLYTYPIGLNSLTPIGLTVRLFQAIFVDS